MDGARNAVDEDTVGRADDSEEALDGEDEDKGGTRDDNEAGA